MDGFGGFTAEELFNNEIGALSLLQGSPGFPKMLQVDRHDLKFSMKNSGDRIASVANQVPHNQYWIQLIHKGLSTMGVRHRDIKRENLRAVWGKVTLIDFEWALYEGSPIEGRELPAGYDFGGDDDLEALKVALEV